MEHKYKLDYPIIAKRIKEARKITGLTQAGLAEKINISENAVAKLENNLMTASLQTLINTANALDVDINYLLNSDMPLVKEETNIDTFLNGLILGLKQKDKEFIIHIINALKIHTCS
ncbi:MAG: helix-turn-helix domain-containing protein [Defluviitaleaceae bacterium]|nr:helix-turn-helix domain-containing protein [Defluviitaleaceae bacterium]